MADLWNYSVASNGFVSALVPSFIVSGQIVSNNHQTIITDFTGVNAINFPNVLVGASVIQQQAIIAELARWVVQYKTGY